MSTDIDILKFYTKNKSIIRGDFLISNTDQFGCINLSKNGVAGGGGAPPGGGGGGESFCVNTGYYFSPFTDGNGNYFSTKQITINGNTTYFDPVKSTARFSLKTFSEGNNIKIDYGGFGITTPPGYAGYYYTDTISYNVEKKQYYTTNNVLTDKDWSGSLNVEHKLFGGFYGPDKWYNWVWSMNLGTWTGDDDILNHLTNGYPYWNIDETQDSHGSFIFRGHVNYSWGAGAGYSVVTDLLPIAVGSNNNFLVQNLGGAASSLDMSYITYNATGIMTLLCPN